MKPHTFPSVIGRALLVLIFGLVISFSNTAIAVSPGGYDKELANGNPDYSKTTEPDGSGGYTERTYYTDANKIKQLVEIKKYNKAKVLTYFWMRYTDAKGNNVTEEFTYPARGGVPEGTKTEVDKDGNTTTYTWDKDRWRFKSRTPKAASSGPSTTEKVLRSVASSVNIGVDIGHGGDEHYRHEGDRRSSDDRSRTADKVRTDDKVRADDKHRTEQKLRTDNKVKVAHDPEITHDREEIDFHKKRKEMFERKLHGKPGPEEKKELEHHINVEEDTIEKYQADLAKRGG